MKLIKESFYHVVGVDELTHKMHTHPDTYELIQILSGEGEFIIDSVAYHFHAGNVMLIDAERFHYSIPREPDNYIRNKLIFSKSLFTGVAEGIGLDQHARLLFGDRSNHTISFDSKTARTLDKYFRIINSNRDPFRSASALIDMLSVLCASVNAPAERNDMLTVILDELNASVGNEFSIDTLSKKVGLSKYYLCHFFKAKTGMKILDYLKWKRIDMAKRMLEKNDAPVSEVALSCGYNSLAYFSKCFKESTGMTPKEYVRKLDK